jgi:hypothetical protein
MEFLLGFHPGHTAPCLSRARARNYAEVWVLERERLTGLSWAPLLAAIVADAWAVKVGLATMPQKVEDFVARLGPFYDPDYCEQETVQTYDVKSHGYEESALLTEQLFRRVSHRGVDLRLGVALTGKPHIWPVRAVPADMYLWMTVVSQPLQMAHINQQESRALLVAVRYRTRILSELNKRAVHLVDSLVTMFALAKGRSSATDIIRILRRTNALILMGGLTMCVGYVSTKNNPADRPSRWLH